VTDKKIRHLPVLEKKEVDRNRLDWGYGDVDHIYSGGGNW